LFISAHRSPGYRITHGLPDVRTQAPEWTERLPLGRAIAESASLMALFALLSGISGAGVDRHLRRENRE
jgi:hypothetical protein